MAYKHSCVIDANGFYQTLVLITADAENFQNAKIQHYTLKEGEKLIDAELPHGFITPMWDGNGWIEGNNTQPKQEKKEMNTESMAALLTVIQQQQKEIEQLKAKTISTEE